MNLSEDAIAKLMEGGYSNLPDPDARDFIDGVQKPEQLRQRYEAAIETYAMAKKIHDVFATGSGPEVLAFYRKQCLDRVQFNPSSPNARDTGFFQSGEANIVLHILNAIKRAEEGPPEPPSELLEADEGEEE